MNRECRVFAAQRNSRYDMTAAENYGQVIYLIDGHVHPMQLDIMVDQILEGLRSNRFNPLYDYVVLSGHLAIVPIFLATICRLYWRDRIRVLLFDSKTSEYVCRVLDLSEKIGETVERKTRVVGASW